MKFDILKNIKRYKWKSMYFKYISSYLALAAISFFGLIAIFIFYFVTSMNHSFEEKNIQSAQATAAIFDYDISSLYSILSELVTDNKVVHLIESNDFPKPPFRTQQILSTYAQFISKQKNTNANLTDVILYNPKCDYVIRTTSSGLSENFAEKSWYPFLSDPDLLEQFSAFYDSDSFYLCQKFYSGLIILQFENIFQSFSMDGAFYLFDQRNQTLIYGSDSAVPVLQSNPKNQTAISYTDHNTMYIQINASHYFTYLFAIPAFNIFTDQTFWTMVFSLAFLLLLLILGLSIYQTNSAYRHITDILALCDSDVSLSHDEWTTISKHLINLSNEKVLIEKDLILKINQIKQLQQNALQAQLTPHFLFNTLHMINLSIQNTVHGDCQGTRMITQLSKFLRSTLDAKNILSLREELVHAKSYIELEQLKYTDYLLINWQIDERCLKLQCPKLILQPLLENSIIHGMKDDAPLTITVSVHPTFSNTILTITDDGAGMDEEQLSQLKKQVRTFPESTHIGLANVLHRLQLYYEDEFSYTIESQKDQGCTITLYLPLG